MEKFKFQDLHNRVFSENYTKETNYLLNIINLFSEYLNYIEGYDSNEDIASIVVNLDLLNDYFIKSQKYFIKSNKKMLQVKISKNLKKIETLRKEKKIVLDDTISELEKETQEILSDEIEKYLKLKEYSNIDIDELRSKKDKLENEVEKIKNEDKILYSQIENLIIQKKELIGIKNSKKENLKHLYLEIESVIKNKIVRSNEALQESVKELELLIENHTKLLNEKEKVYQDLISKKGIFEEEIDKRDLENRECQEILDGYKHHFEQNTKYSEAIKLESIKDEAKKIEDLFEVYDKKLKEKLKSNLVK